MKRKTTKKTGTKISLDAAASTFPKAPESQKEMDLQINRRAYDLYLARSRKDGEDHGDWFRAEKEIMDAQKQC
jgi:hypothetical protein